MIWARVSGLFMGGTVSAVVGAGFGVEFRHMVNIRLTEAAAVVDGGNFCR